MKLKVVMEMDSAAFGDDGYRRASEAARILKVLANRLEEGRLEDGTTFAMSDFNGNRVGWAVVTED